MSYSVLDSSYGVLLSCSYDVRNNGTQYEKGAPGVVTEGLGKRYDDLWALRDLDLEVPAGTVLGLLGHNGAGKTTAIRILSTLTRPTTGRAWVAGFDVTEEPRAVRASLGLAGQYATVDGLMSARANLEMVGRLYHLPRAEARQRAGELLERLGLTEAADRLVRTFSGGMRRRLDLAASLVAAPAGAVPRRAHHRARPPEPQRPLGRCCASWSPTARRSC